MFMLGRKAATASPGACRKDQRCTEGAAQHEMQRPSRRVCVRTGQLSISLGRQTLASAMRQLYAIEMNVQ
jgi:hypothetical protein